jgi:DNA-binding CsgD family transcriptional regulator
MRLFYVPPRKTSDAAMKIATNTRIWAALLAIGVAAGHLKGQEGTKTPMSHPVFYPTVKVDGLSIFYREAGPMDGPTILLLRRLYLLESEKAFERYRENRREAIEHESIAARYRTLALRERQVLSLLVPGSLNKQAGFELGITEYTVQIHRGSIMRKMEADSSAVLVRLVAKLTTEPPFGQ